jgi:hypothetical protein
VDHPQGTTILVLGILGLVTCGLLGIVAWVMGNGALADIDAAPGYYANRSNVATGRILGIVSTCLLVAGVAVYALMAIVLVGLGTLSAGS